jgi:uncharacterized protein YajQ (UPF0234 family)
MPSFDIVSEVDMDEVQNAINQAQKELANRFDFKGANASIVLEKETIKLAANEDFKLTALQEIVLGKLAKRNISLKNIEIPEADVTSVGNASKTLKIKQGMETEQAKKLTAFLKDAKLKVQAQIQERKVRVTGKSRDELQEAIGLLRNKEFELALAFNNFRD